MSNDGRYSSSDLNRQEPEDLLMTRLLRQEQELSDYKLAYSLVYDSFLMVSEALNNIIESLPEPIILYEIVETITDPDYKEYLKCSASLIDTFKMNLCAGEQLFNEITKQKRSEDINEQ